VEEYDRELRDGDHDLDRSRTAATRIVRYAIPPATTTAALPLLPGGGWWC
jgi:hypothetical protein